MFQKAGIEGGQPPPHRKDYGRSTTMHLIAYTFARRCLEARKLRGWTRSELCARAGLSASYLIGIEKYIRCPSLVVSVLLAGALGVKLTHLLQEGPIRPEQLLKL